MGSPIDIYSLTFSKARLVYMAFAVLDFHKYYFSNYTVSCSFLLGLVPHGLETIKEAFLPQLVVGLQVSFKWHQG